MRLIENDLALSAADGQSAKETVTIADIWKAHKLLKPRLHHTPLEPSRTLHDLTGANVYLKAENMQRSGSFKVRGASYKLSRLSEQEHRSGVVAASAGNHAQGVAIAAANDNIPCTIVMPETAPLAKVTATQGYGANVVLHGFTYDDAYQYCLDLQEQSGAIFVHAFDDPDVIAGQGTLIAPFTLNSPFGNLPSTLRKLICQSSHGPPGPQGAKGENGPDAPSPTNREQLVANNSEIHHWTRAGQIAGWRHSEQLRVSTRSFTRRPKLRGRQR